ncbi:radical SAM protein [candidate division KSB1 bacterium]|nr:radical SAM protein [candidate division KSB1 bacterium]
MPGSQQMTEMRVMSTPRHVDIAITGKCNLACQYCFYADEMVARTHLPTDRWLSLFDELGQMGVMTVTLTGGEIFTRSDFFELIDGIIANHMRYNLLSNGTLITEDVLEKFEIGKRRQRLDTIQISVDGSTAVVHDRSRPKSFDRALNGLQLLQNGGFPVTARVTVNRYNVDDLENVAYMLLEKVGLSNFGTNEAYACGATDQTENKIILTLSQRQKAMRILEDLADRYDQRIQALAGPLAMAQNLKRIEGMLIKGQTGLKGKGTLSACNGVFSKIAILHDGTIVPCHAMSTLRLGKIGINSLQDVWKNDETLKALRLRQHIPLSSLETCRDCKYQNFCTGGCPAGALYANGDFNTRNPMDCYCILKGQDSFIPKENDITR